MTDPLTTLLVDVEWLAVEIKQDRGGDYLQESETGNGITLAELVKRYNSLLSAPSQPALTDADLSETKIGIKDAIECFSIGTNPSNTPTMRAGGSTETSRHICGFTFDLLIDTLSAPTQTDAGRGVVVSQRRLPVSRASRRKPARSKTH